MTSQLLKLDPSPDRMGTELDLSHLVTEDDTPVDGFQSEVQERLLVEPIYSSQVLPAPFLVAANVGLFYELKADPVVPDVLLSLGVQRADDLAPKQNRSYFVWRFGKPPDVCIEIVSNPEGDEVGLSRRSRQKGKTQSKMQIYAQIGVTYYAVFDPFEQIQGNEEMNGALSRVWELQDGRYVELTPIEGIREVGQCVWLERVGLGLTLWQGSYEEKVSRLWLRWCDQQGKVIPTGAERAKAAQYQAEAAQHQAEAAQHQAEIERQRSERLAQKLRELGLDPDQL